MCVCVTLKRFVAFCARTTRCNRHSLTLGQYTSLPLFITFYSLLAYRETLPSFAIERYRVRGYIYIRFASSSSVRCFVNTRDHHHQQRSRTRKKTSSSSSFWYKPKSFLLSHVLFKVFSYSSGVFVLICSACNPFSLNSSSRSAYTCRCLATCFMP